MVGVNSFKHHFGTVAIFATLFAAIQVNGDKGCVFDFEHTSDFDLKCNDLQNSWTAKKDDKLSPAKKVLTLEPNQDGCFKTKDSIILNSTAPVSFRFYREGPKEEGGKFEMVLIPKEGSCGDECTWDISKDPQYKTGEWVNAEHKFPLNSMKEYYVQVQVGKSKGKSLVDYISLSNAYGDSSRCKSMEGGIRAANEAGMNDFSVPSQLVATGQNGSASFCPGFAEISKNLMLTSASVLTLNNLLN